MQAMKKSPYGFTIVELMIVVLIIGLLSVLATVGLTQGRRSARSAEANLILKAIHNAEKQYFFKKGRYWGPGGPNTVAEINTALDINLQNSNNFVFDVTSLGLGTDYTATLTFVRTQTGSPTSRITYRTDQTGEITYTGGG
jgi:prepilin-type N-terminal cleavage/methylation domain-containing protein